ncbi:hypothetical protein D3C87_2210390 [compost metagenome]
MVDGAVIGDAAQSWMPTSIWVRLIPEARQLSMAWAIFARVFPAIGVWQESE